MCNPRPLQHIPPLVDSPETTSSLLRAGLPEGEGWRRGPPGRATKARDLQQEVTITLACHSPSNSCLWAQFFS